MAAILIPLSGCGGSQRQWEITYENKSDVPCSFFVTMGTDGSGKASVENVAPGKPFPLDVGIGETIVRTVKVVRGKDEQTLTPEAKLPGGKRFAIVVGADGKVETSISDR